MIIVKLKGGLGNQMFQYALGRRVALDNNQNLKLDISWFQSQEKRQFELNNFNICADIASERELRKYFPSRREGLPSLIPALLNRYESLEERIYVEKKSGKFDLSALSAVTNRYFDGYWQSEKYFKGIEKIIKEDFTLKSSLSIENQLLADEIHNNPNSIGIHVRRGDYVSDLTTSQEHLVCDSSFFNDAMRILKNKLGKEIYFYVFSDDPEWCESGLIYPSDHKVVSDGRRASTDELVLLSLCRNFIISNSSYGWWGAWLNKNPTKEVIYPKKWFASQDAPDIPVASWSPY